MRKKRCLNLKVFADQVYEARLYDVNISYEVRLFLDKLLKDKRNNETKRDQKTTRQNY